MSESEPQAHTNKARRESLGIPESDLAAQVGWSVKKIKDYESGKVPVSTVDEERISIAIDSLASRKSRK